MSTKHRAISCDVQNVIGKTCTIGRQISQQLFAVADVNAVPTLYRQSLFYEYPRNWALPFPPHPIPSHTISVEEQLAGASFITCTLAPHPRRWPMYRTHVYPYRTHVPNVPYPCTQCTVPCTVHMYPKTVSRYSALLSRYSGLRFLGTCVRYIGYMGTVHWVHGYGRLGTWMRYMGTVRVRYGVRYGYGTWVRYIGNIGMVHGYCKTVRWVWSGGINDTRARYGE